MSIKNRKAITIGEEDWAMTFLRPYSGEWKDYLIVVEEDAYGEFKGILKPIKEIKDSLNISDAELHEMLVKLV